MRSDDDFDGEKPFLARFDQRILGFLVPFCSWKLQSVRVVSICEIQPEQEGKEQKRGKTSQKGGHATVLDWYEHAPAVNSKKEEKTGLINMLGV